MSNNGGVRIAVVGLGFGEQFLPIYLSHPGVRRVGVVEPDEARRQAVADRYDVKDRYATLEEALQDPEKMLFNELVSAWNTSICHRAAVGDDGRGTGLSVCENLKTLMNTQRRPNSH